MLADLKKVFPSLIYYSTSGDKENSNYKWFKTPEDEIIGINKDDLTQKEASILEAFLKPYQPSFPVQTDKERRWLNRIHQTKDQDDKVDFPFRFVYFNLSVKQIEPLVFKEAINDLFAEEVSILWENEKEGIIIEERDTTIEEIISYEQIIDTLMSDLYVKINFLVGPFQEDFQAVSSHYRNMTRVGYTAFKYSDKNVLTFMEAIPFILMEQADFQFKKDLSHQMLREFATDKEFFKTIDMLLQCNLNVSVAAKKLYMHRNSLQYRLDRFKKRTGIDVRSFHHALAIYLALLANRNL